MNSLLSNSLFSTIITLHTLLLLYFPSFLLPFIFSPVLISTIILLLYLLKLGATQNSAPELHESNSPEFIDHVHNAEPDISLIRLSDPDPKSKPFYDDSFVEWDVKAPLKVIYEYEEYEGDETEENDGVFEENRESQINIIRNYGSLSLFYPQSDSDTSSDGEFSIVGGEWEPSENMCFRWEDGEGREGLIEIALDDRKRISDFDEEDNLIEIDLFPVR